MTASRTILPFALVLLLPMAAQAGDKAPSDEKPTGISAEIRQDMAEARREIREDMAKARRELETENLRLDNGMQFGRDRNNDKDLPKAEITARGDLLIEDKAQPVNPAQRRQLLAYRGQVIKLGQAGIDLGERSAYAALGTIANRSFTGLLWGGLTGSLERRLERTLAREIEPAVRDVCRQLPAVMASQQQLAASVPQFRPYATLEKDDVKACMTDARKSFASR